MNKVKQVIVVRKDLNMRKGKLAAQTAHAAMGFMTSHYGCEPLKGSKEYEISVFVDETTVDWLNSGTKKIVCQIESLHELLCLVDIAKRKGIKTHVVTDSGLTEFDGIPTITCAAFGPDLDEDLDSITNHLKLF